MLELAAQGHASKVSADSLAVGAILSATDSVCTLQVLNQDETPLLYSIVFGEGVVNDATSIVLFNAVQSLDVSNIDLLTALKFLGTFLYLFFTSTALGIAGQGACHFLQWEDTQEITTINDLVDESKHGISVDSTSTSHELVTKMGDLSINNLKRKFDSLEMENPQHLPTSVAVHEHFEKDQEPVIERSEHDETSENLTSTKYIDPSRVEDSSNLQDLVVLEVELTAIQGIHGESIGVSNIFFALGTEPFKDLDRIFSEIETEFEDQRANNAIEGWENMGQENGHVPAQHTVIDLHYYSTVEELVEVGPEKLIIEACYRYNLELHKKEEIAEEIARLRSAVSAITESKKSAKGAPAQLLDAFSKLEVNNNRNLERAMKEITS
ncbi:uncharacterized protein LOC115982214 isoform X1 [Quercus lobata]|uniref:uncharacterized protein LOC115981483 isoform X1 n=1 Tax=Quercus lobata TaxID=97700 RepID=UPI001248B62B|nr:uncharacterized protein LOC115981483 isoform X1 [Quercus lobata]XP_030960608.1 uncharacterized protein LOC115982214 isoform X1 [Quercus lobata]